MRPSSCKNEHNQCDRSIFIYVAYYNWVVMATIRARPRGTKSKRNVAGKNFAVILLDSSLPGQK